MTPAESSAPLPFVTTIFTPGPDTGLSAVVACTVFSILQPALAPAPPASAGPLR